LIAIGIAMPTGAFGEPSFRQPAFVASEIAIALRRPAGYAAILSDYWAITKPEVNFLIVVTTGAGFCLSGPGGLFRIAWIPLLHTLLGTLLVASGAAALNQWIERPFDARMRRTARRPIVAGRIEPRRALMFGAALSVCGLAYLALDARIVASLLAAITLVSYLFVYTPLKRRTPWCTAIGAVPGAIPPLIGAAAARGGLDLTAWILFTIVFLWQFPHFMAIAWMYRDDYDRAGYVVLPRPAARARFIAWQTLAPLMALLPVTLVPILYNSSAAYGAAAAALSLWFTYAGAQFVRRPSAAAARRLLLTSIVYLPALLLLLIIFTT
jgi:heme o synthase